MLNVICMNHGNYLGRGADYVQRLNSGLVRYMPNDMDWQFLEFVDEDFTPGQAGWWNKIELFSPRMFKEGERVLYLDLDTIICGSMADIAGYDGEFAMLSDFFHPNQLASGMMAWRVSEKTHEIWNKYCMVGRPQFDPRGDQGFIGTMMSQADQLQDLFPNQIFSFKADCLVGVPASARIVAFHGHPRPHVLSDLLSYWQ